MKTFSISQNIGKARYIVSFHDGTKQHRDKSPFYDVAIFNNKTDLNKFTNDLLVSGYTN